MGGGSDDGHVRRDTSHPTGERRQAFDWKGWIVVAWVLWFGLLYGQMVVAQRGQKIRALIAALKRQTGISAAADHR